LSKQRLIFSLICLILLLRTSSFLWTLEWPPGYDARSYIAAAQAFQQGYSPYDDATWQIIKIPVSASKYLYPPLLAVLLMPLTSLSIIPATYVCIGLSALSAMWLIFLLRPLLGWRVALIGVLLFPPTWHTIYLGQINLLIACLFVIAIQSYRQRQENRLGAALALGTILKITPILAYFVLFLRGYRRSLAAWLAVVGRSVVVTLPFASIQTWLAGGSAALSQRWFNPEFRSWTGMLAYWWPGYGEALGLILSVSLLVITLLRARKLPLGLALAAAIILPLLVARIIWDHHAVMALPALVLMWQAGADKRLIAAAAWLLIGLLGGITMPLLLTLCWLVCCWPEHKLLRKLRTTTTDWQKSLPVGQPLA
jgi:hypothetical protein